MADGLVTITVDGVSWQVPEGQNLLQACLSRGIDLPYFCWHPALGSVGACRQCAVVQYADPEDERGRLTMACMTPVAEGARFSAAAGSAMSFRAWVIEWLMENHPHDCPVCEEGGECHLQDMTVMTGHTSRRYRGRKRTFENQYLGPFLNHEMNRCITCYRCVRFYRDYAGGTDLQAFGSRSRMYFGRDRDGVLENEFAGNLVEVCPTGVFTDKPFSESYSRKWDLTSAPSVCTGCAVGCNTFAAERYDRLKRITNRYHGALNGYFLCDRGRFGGHFVNADARIRNVGIRVDEDLFEAVPVGDGLTRLADLIGRGNPVGIGSPRASLETNAVLKQLVGEQRFSGGSTASEADQLERSLAIYRSGTASPASITDVEQADAVLVLGEDLPNTASRVALALRQMVRNRSLELAIDAGIPQWQDAGVRSHGRYVANPLFIASILPTRLADVATAALHDRPAAIADAGFAIAGLIGGVMASSNEFVQAAASALAEAQRPLVISGTGPDHPGVLEAASAVAAALEERGAAARMLLIAPECNSFGSALLGGQLTLESALEAAAGNTLIVTENDLYRRLDRASVDRALASVAGLVVIDSLDTPTATRADLVFPAATFAETVGTLVNMETRAQRFYPAMRPRGDIAPSWRFLVAAAELAGRNDLGWTHADEVLRAMADHPGLSALAGVIPDSRGSKIPRAAPRYSGRTAMNAASNIHEPKTPVDEETPFSWSMEGRLADQPAGLLPYVWSPGWNSNQSVFKFQQEVGGPLLGGDAGVRLVTGGERAEPSGASAGADEPGARPAPAADECHLLPLQTLFGGDELSGRSPPVAERAPPPFLVLNSRDAGRLSLTAGGGARCDGMDVSLEVRIDDAMRDGYAGISVGLGAVPTPTRDPVRLAPDPDYRRPPDPSDTIARG